MTARGRFRNPAGGSHSRPAARPLFRLRSTAGPGSPDTRCLRHRFPPTAGLLRGSRHRRLSRLPLWLLPVVLAIAFLRPAILSGQDAAGDADLTRTDARLFMWKAQISSSEVHLLGSIHVLSPDFYPLPPAIVSVIEEADILLLEVDLSVPVDQGYLLSVILEQGYYLDGSSLSDHIPEKLYREVMIEAGKAGIPKEDAELTKPWLLSIILQAAALAGNGFSAGSGMESAVLSLFRGGEIGELEGLEMQLDLLSGLTDKDQMLFLESSVGQISEITGMMDQIIGLWRSGDAAGLGVLLETGTPAARSFTRRLIHDRNRNMADVIVETALRSPGTILVVAGAAHFTGPEGLPAILAERGYPVFQVANR